MPRTTKSTAPAFDPVGLSFLFTGTLATMTRAAAEKRVKTIGGIAAKSVGKTLGVLVIGDKGSPLYGQGAKGDKQTKVESLNAKGAGIHVISETDFLSLGAADAAPLTPTEIPTATEASKPLDNSTLALCAAAAGDDIFVMVGGLGTNTILSTRDGKKWALHKTGGKGLRAIHIEGDDVWVAGEWGAVSRTTTAFKKLTALDVPTSSCLFGITRASDGQLWICGDSGFLARSPDNESVIKVGGIKQRVSKVVDTVHGLLVASHGGLYRIVNNKPKKLALSAKLDNLLVTKAGTILAIGGGNVVHRSVDGGKTFKKAKVPAFTKNKSKYAKLATGWWGASSSDLSVITALADGRILVAGDGGVILASCDDGLSWRRVPHDVSDRCLWAAGSFRGDAFIGGENRLIVRLR